MRTTDLPLASFPRKTARWSDTVYFHDGLEAFNEEIELPRGLHTVQFNNMWVDFFFKRRRKKTLLVVHHGAKTKAGRSKIKFPVFSGQNIAADLPVDVLMFSDASLHHHPNLTLAWHVGDTDHDLQFAHAEIVKKIVALNNYKRVIFLGGSGGGFAALVQASRLPDSIAVVYGPQTQIGKYHQRLRNEFSKCCFGADKFEDIILPSNDARVLSVLPTFETGKVDCTVLYMQNLKDSHLKTHAEPFASAVAQRRVRLRLGQHQCSDRVLIDIGDWLEGHGPAPKEFARAVLREIVSAPEANSKLVSSGAALRAVRAGYEAIRDEGSREEQ